MTPDFFMREALKEAEKAFEIGEVPVGAVIERHGQIIGRGHNRTETGKDPTAHARLSPFDKLRKPWEAGGFLIRIYM